MDSQMENKRQAWIDRYTDGVRKGIYKFADIGARDTKKVVKDNLMPEIENGTANEVTINAVATYLADEIHRKRMALADVPDCIYKLVAEKV